MSRFVTVTTAAILLVIMLFISWYEGSGIIEDSLSWGSSTPLTNQLGINIQTGKEIVVADYFYYSLKTNPLYMMVTFLCAGVMLFICSRSVMSAGICAVVFLAIALTFFASRSLKMMTMVFVLLFIAFLGKLVYRIRFRDYHFI